MHGMQGGGWKKVTTRSKGEANEAFGRKLNDDPNGNKNCFGRKGERLEAKRRIQCSSINCVSTGEW